MNYLLAKLKGKNGLVLKVISSSNEIIDEPELSALRAYEPSYKLDDEEWFFLEKYSDSSYANELITDRFNSTKYNQVVRSDFVNFKYFWLKQNGKYYFQKIMPSQIITKKWFKVSDEPQLQESGSIVVLNNWADAVYLPGEDRLIFKDVSRIKTFFPGIEAIYREATNEEVEEFLGQDFLLLSNDYGLDQVKIPNRKRIALAMDTLRSFRDEDRQYIFRYIQDYCSDLLISGESFEISNEEELKKVLWGIEQRYYTTPLGNEKRLANSVTAIG